MRACKCIFMLSFVIVTHLIRSSLLIEYLKSLESTHDDHALATDALDKICVVANHINDSMKQKENAARLLELQAMLAGVNILKPGRVLIKRGAVQKMCRKGPQPRVLCLFADMLLYAKEHTVITTQYVDVQLIDFADIKTVVSTPMLEYEHTIRILSALRSFVLVFDSAKHHTEWLTAIQAAVSEFNAKQQTLSPRTRGSRTSTSSSTPSSATTADGGVAVFCEVAPLWIPDAGVSMCMICFATFTLVRRRHHCRACGKVRWCYDESVKNHDFVLL
jgi:hypothetical protein